MPTKMIFFSSSAAYPIKFQQEGNPAFLSEKMIDFQNKSIDIGFPDLSYGWAKLTGEYLAHIAHQSHGLNVVVYRPMSGYGEDQHESYPFTSILKKIMRLEDPVKIWSDGTRDFVHINDIVKCVLKSHARVRNGSVINLATGIGTNFSFIARRMSSLIGYNPRIILDQNMPMGVHFRVGDPQRAVNLGCITTVSLDMGMKKAIKYHRQSTNINHHQT